MLRREIPTTHADDVGVDAGMAVDAVLSAVGARDKQKETRDSEPKTDAAIMRKIQKVFKFAE